MPAIEARVARADGRVHRFRRALARADVGAPRRGAQSGAARARGAQRRRSSEPLVVAGDFNVTPYSPYFRDWLAASGLTDSRRGRTLSVSWPATLPWFGIPIDHVAVNDGFTIVSHRRLPDFGSDHYGVVVELALRGGEHP